MFAFERWLRPAIGVMGCAVLGAVCVPDPAGAAPTLQMRAVVRADGTLARGQGVISAQRLEVGTYTVKFEQPVSGCAYEATPGDPGTDGIGGSPEVTVASQNATPKGVFVQTFDQTTGVPTDMPFHITTYCGKKGDYAVVGDDGTLARGAHATASDQIRPGEFEVFFDHDVHECAFTATIGTTSTGEVVNPGVISVAARAQVPNGVFVKTLNRFGSDANFPFHLAVDCSSTSLTAVVFSDGRLARGHDAVTAGRVNRVARTGAYEVIFDRDVSLCTYTASLGDPGDGAFVFPATIQVARRLGRPKGVFLAVENAAGGVRDAGFHLKVTC